MRINMNSTVRIDKKDDKKIYIIAWTICVLGMLVCFVLRAVFKAKYISPCIVIFVTTVIFAFVMTRIKCEIDELKYKAILIFSSITKFIFVFGCTFENKLFTKEAYTENEHPLILAAYILLPILVAIELYIFYKNKKSNKLKIYIIVCFWIIHYLGVTNIYSFWSLMILVPV